MAQPPPRKGAYNKFVVNLHKEQYTKLQAKHQQELDLLDDIRNFMKQRAAIEKHYAEGLLKLSNVYGNKKIATIEDLPENARINESEHNIYQLWRIILDENEKISKARLAAVQVFQEKISDDAKNVRTWKNLTAKRSLDRLSVVQKDVQFSVSEVDRTKRHYFCEETDALDIASKAQDADLKARGKKKDVRSLFQSKSALKKQAVKLSAKQDESEIKSTGTRNDYLLSLVTANAHQDRYFHYDLQYSIREMEAGIYEKMSDYFGTLARTELLTCGALQNSFGRIKDGAETINREYNYRCYIKAFPCLGDHVQYAFEAVEGDAINTITPSEHDAGYSLNYEARNTAAKLNQAVKTIRAYNKRIKACRHHKSKGLKQEPNDPNGPNLDEKILELETAIRNAETERAKCEARLHKLREGNVPVDEYLDSTSIAALDEEIRNEAMSQYSSSNDTPQVETPVVDQSAQQYDDSQEAVMENGGSPVADDEGWPEAAQDNEAAQADWANQNQEGWPEENAWNDQPEEPQVDEEGNVTEDQAQAEAQSQIEIDPNAEVWKAVSLFQFDGQNEDELSVAENEEVDILVKECDEEGWVMTRNKTGQRGYVPYNYIQVYDFVMKDDSPFASTQQRSNSITSSSGQVVRQPSIESNASWGFPGASVMPSIPEQPPVQELNSSDEEEDDSSDGGMPPGLGAPPGPPPMTAPPSINVSSLDPDTGKKSARPISIQFGASMDSEYCKALYDYDANGQDELSFKEDDVVHIISRSPHGVEDGWWMGELNGNTGLFPSIVVEECQANGDDWSPDVSMGSPSSVAPPCFTPPPLDAPPGPPPGLPQAPPQLPEAPPPPAAAPPPLPAAPPPALPAAPPPAKAAPIIPPAKPTAPPPAKSSAGPPAKPAAGPPAKPAVPPPATAPSAAATVSSGLMLPETMIMITNPTPVVEEASAEREEQAVSYHVEDPNFSMTMSKERRIRYKQESSVPAVEISGEVPSIAISVDEPSMDEPSNESSQQQEAPIPAAPVAVKPQPPPESSNCLLTFTEITVTAPTPKVQSPEEESAGFPVAEKISSSTVEEKLEEGVTNGATTATESDGGWAAFGEPAKDTSGDGSVKVGGGGGADWANFESQPEPVLADATSEKSTLPAGILADLQESDDSNEEKPAAAKKAAADDDSDSEAAAPTEKEDSDDMRSDREQAADSSSDDDTESEKKSGYHAKTSSDSDSDDDRGPSRAARSKKKPTAESSSDEDEKGAKPRKTADSSDTESGAEDSSVQSSPRKPKKGENIPLPSEDFEPKQLKKLETMKESPA